MKIFKNLIFICCLCICCSACAQNQPSSAISTMEGDTISWRDKQGQHFLLIKQSDISRNEDEGTSAQSINLTHWLKEDDKLTETWSDQVKITNCEGDVEVKILAAPQFPDIDNDGFNEVFFVVQKSCKGYDIGGYMMSTYNVEVVMVDHKNIKYYLETYPKTDFHDGTVLVNGSYRLGDFEDLPKPFRDFAVRYLKEHCDYTLRWRK